MDVSGLTSGVSAITAGYNHSCAVLTTGALKCWGRNNYGQLGDNSTADRNSPVNVNGLSSGVSTASGGEFHTCALTTSGGVKCWGDNQFGQLGDGTNTDRNTPVNVSGLTSGVSALTVGYNHSCAVLTTGALKCWGRNNYGQLGDNSTTDRNTPVNALFGSGTAYTYNASHKHAVASLSTGETYSYDANGNMTQRVEGGQTYTQTFDAENRLISVVVGGQTTQFIYDGDGNLVKKINPSGSKTLYVGGIYEIDKASGGSVTRTVTYYPVAGAMRINNTLYYTLKDHLGSASVVTDASGTILGTQRYYPFGETRLTTGTIYTDKLYTGQREMAGLGIYHYQARFYSPKIGRFLSADTIVPGYTDPQSLNRYSYVLGNPLKYIDPTGHCSVSGHWIPDSSSACQWASNNQGSLTGNGNGGFVGVDDDDELDPSEPDLHIEVGNSDCDIACQQTLQGIFVAATTLDSIATSLNFGYAVVADIGLYFGGPAAYATMLILYRGLSVVPNLIGSAGGALWIYSGFLSGENHFEMTINDGIVDVSGSIAQDTIAAVVFDGLGWSPLAADPNVATGINAGGVIYDIARNPFDPMLPTFLQPTFSFSIDTNNLGIP